MNRKSKVVATLVSSFACLAILQTASAGQKPADPPPAAPPQAERTDGIYDALGLVERDASLVTIAQGFGFTEGPAVDSKGNVYFTDQPNDRIHRWDAKTGSVTLWLQGTGRANGMIFDRDDNLIAAADMHGELWKIFADGSHKVLIDNHQGKLLNGPNDVWIDAAGGIYLTDPIFPRGYWDANDPRQQPWEPTRSEQSPQGKGGHVYYLPPGGRKVVRMTSDALGWESDSWPNGVTGSPDGRKLYVNKWFYDNKGGTFVFDVRRDGTLKNMRKFTEWGGDGMSTDELGNVYISNGLGVMGFDPNGNHILTIPTGTGATNNTFAGRDGRTLFITGPVDKVTAIRMKVRGATSWRHRH